MVIFGDPMWRPSVAPALQWASVVWLARTSPSASRYNVKEIAQLWRAVPFGDKVTCRSSRGPLQRMHLSLIHI
eukprot:2801407-Pyramimonas_sp.AAC.1